MPICYVIGAGPGLGTAIAHRFARAGHDVGLVARNEATLAGARVELRDAGVRVEAAAADAGVPEQFDAAFDHLDARLGPCDVLVYNVAAMHGGRPREVGREIIAEDSRVNVLGAHHAACRVAPVMADAGRAAILFTGGGLALEPYPEWTSLAMGKAALRSLAISLHKDLAPEGVRVAIIAVCGIVAPGGPFDPDGIAETYWRVATDPALSTEREVVIQPEGTDPFYNDPDRRHAATSRLPEHVRMRTSG